MGTKMDKGNEGCDGNEMWDRIGVRQEMRQKWGTEMGDVMETRQDENYLPRMGVSKVGYPSDIFSVVILLGRSIDLGFLIGQRMNKIFRENIDFLFERFESQDICSVVELQQLFDVLKLTHQLLAEYLSMDPFTVMLNEMSENISLVSFSGRLASQCVMMLRIPLFSFLQLTQFMQCTQWLIH
eukprot:Gb_18363 [translate_table: standard]